jgi:alpha-D-ribose 1-methylphosphonate 5-triphosphate synthase subunit PhnH
MNKNTLSAGFADPVHESQRAFRAALEALSRPGTTVSLGSAVAGVALHAATAHLLLTLTDEETPVWWQQADAQAVQWLRFHTGAPLAPALQGAAFAVLATPTHMPPLDSFALGSAEAPEFSSTLLIEVPSLESGPAMQWSGPGIRDTVRLAIAGLPQDFWAQWQANHALFPQGVDIIFCCADRAVGLPRSTRVQAQEGV